jgi:hypothetical protein
MLKVRQVNPTRRFAFLRLGLSPPKAIVGETDSEVAQCDLRSEFRGKPRQTVRALPRALAAGDLDDDEWVKREGVAIVHPF